MTPIEAARLLDLSVEAASDQIEARFLDLRRKLEDKIAKAPTPGLQAKYRESLADITTAFETLTLAADSSALPVLKRESGDRRPEAGAAATLSHSEGWATDPVNPAGFNRTPLSPSAPTQDPRPSSARKSGKEFGIVALIAVLVLAAGGWWVMKTRAENEEKARIVASARAEAEHLAAAEKANAERRAEADRAAAVARQQAAEEEKVRFAAAAKASQELADKRIAALRSRAAVLNVIFETLFREEPARANRQLSELRAEERSVGRDASGPAVNRLRARLDSQQALVDQIDTLLARHPAKQAQARANEFISARQPDEAGEALDVLAAQLAALEAELQQARTMAGKSLVGSVVVENPYPDADWTFVDAFGEEFRGRESTTISPAGVGAGLFTYRRPDWAEQRQTVLVRPGPATPARVRFLPATVRLTSSPEGADYLLPDGTRGQTPATFSVSPGRLSIKVSRRGYDQAQLELEAGAGVEINPHVTLTPAALLSDLEVNAFVAALRGDNVVRASDQVSWFGTRVPVPGMGPGSETTAVYFVTFQPVVMRLRQAPPALEPGWFPPAGETLPRQRTKLGVQLGWGTDLPFTPDTEGYVILSGVLKAGRLSWFSDSHPHILEGSDPGLMQATKAWLVQSGSFAYTGRAPEISSLVYLLIKHRRH